MSLAVLACLLAVSVVHAAPCPADVCEIVDSTDPESLRPLIPQPDLCTCTCNDEDETPLHRAARSECVLCADLLVKENGCDVDVMDANGNAPLHTAASVCQSPMTNLFLDLEAYADNLNNAGNTPICVGALTDDETCGGVVRSIGEKGGNFCIECLTPHGLPYAVAANKVVKDVIAQDGGQPAPDGDCEVSKGDRRSAI